jgi:hypothetical protein
LLITAGLLWALLVWDPFLVAKNLAARLSGPVREDALVTNVYQDPATQEVTNGEAPLSGLTRLESEWCNTADASRYVLMGNSQTFTVLLAPSEASASTAERTYPDQIIERAAARGQPVQGYRLAAPNLSYAEVLWYLDYLLARKCAAPARLIIQLNYESFRKTSIRAGMLELLADPDFAARAAREAESRAAHAAAFRQAIDHFHELKARTQGARDAASAATSKTGLTQNEGIGPRLEGWLRGVLDEAPRFQARSVLKAEFLTTLYLLRVNVLGITPTTKRSLSSVALAQSISALDRVGELCAQNHIKLEFFLAPQNPRAVLYRTDADRRQYLDITAELARRYAWRSANLEDVIPADMWGVWVDGPDPIHFGRAAHARMAQAMIGAGLVPGGS